MVEEKTHDETGEETSKVEESHEELDTTAEKLDDTQTSELNTSVSEQPEHLETKEGADHAEHERTSAEVLHQKKEAKRKQRQQNKFADGNLIPEEGDGEV